jgi:hypothetical protein
VKRYRGNSGNAYASPLRASDAFAGTPQAARGVFENPANWLARSISPNHYALILKFPPKEYAIAIIRWFVCHCKAEAALFVFTTYYT